MTGRKSVVEGSGKVRARLPTAAIAFPGRSRARLLTLRDADGDGGALVSLIWLHYPLAGSIVVRLREDEARGRVPLSSISRAVAAVGQETHRASRVQANLFRRRLQPRVSPAKPLSLTIINNNSRILPIIAHRHVRLRIVWSPTSLDMVHQWPDTAQYADDV